LCLASSANVTELAEETRMSTGKVKAIVKGLIASGYVKKASARE
jgi:DNA-binding MarR family transcriptional regulator